MTSFGFPISELIRSPTRWSSRLLVGKGNGDALRVGLGSVWLSNFEAGTVWRIDPKRIAATTSQNKTRLVS